MFCRESVKYFRHLLTPTGIKADSAEITAISKLPAPTSLKQLQSSLQYIEHQQRKFVRNFAAMAELLTR